MIKIALACFVGLLFFVRPSIAQNLNYGPSVTPVVGTWTATDTSGGGFSLTSTCAYTRIGNMVFIYGTVTYPNTGSNSATVTISGLPVAPANQNYIPFGFVTIGGAANSAYVLLQKGSTTFTLYSFAGGTPKTNVNVSTAALVFSFSYPIQ